MRRERNPDERFHSALLAQNEPTHPFEKALWQLKQGVDNDVTERVVDAYECTFERELLQAWIIAGASDEDINRRIGMSLEMLIQYRHLCCNAHVFRDKLEMMRWVHTYKGSRAGKILLEKALHFDGVEAIAHLCGLPTALTPEHVNEQVLRESYFRGISTLRASSVSGADALAAHHLMKTATATALAVKSHGGPNLAEAMLKLKHREVTWHVEDLGPHGEILH